VSDSPNQYALNDDQREFRTHLRQFCEDKIAPRAAEVDRNAEYPWDNFKECVAMELPALGIPEEYGGAGADHVTQAVMVEELSRVCASTSLMMLISKLGMIPVINWGSGELKAKYLPRVASGEGQASYCLSEPDAGSDVAAMKTRAVRDGSGDDADYIISGTKYWITNAGISDTYTVFAKTDPEAGHRGISCFLVEADWGVKVTKLEEKLGVRGSPTGEVLFDEVRVPAANRIGEEGQGFYIAMGTLDRSRPTIGAQAVGIAQGAIDYAGGYMKQRQQFGKPIAEFQGLQFMLADMAMKNEAARGLVYRACSIIDAGDPHKELTMAGAMAKCFASDVAMEVTTNAVQLLGGYGYTKEFPVERYMRDAKITQIYEGTNQVQRVVISKRLLG
jgi:alkylation response protein AidB-like acyl-CoA dehydrogenase